MLAVDTPAAGGAKKHASRFVNWPFAIAGGQFVFFVNCSFQKMDAVNAGSFYAALAVVVPTSLTQRLSKA
jgi:hypothetical protein